MKDIYGYKHTEIFNPHEQERLTALLGRLVEKLGENRSALDFGAGTGNVTHKLLYHGCAVTACDISQASLDLLRSKASPDASLSTALTSGHDLPFSDNQFDLVTTYSVLHHVPDYLHLAGEFLRVLKPGGILFVDHEHNERHWLPDAYLHAYQHLTRRTFLEHLHILCTTGEIVTFDFLKTLLIKLFINPRYEREGDLHVWPDDHIEWNRLIERLESSGGSVLEQADYLLYSPKGGPQLYQLFHDRCADMKYLVVQKRR